MGAEGIVSQRQLERVMRAAKRVHGQISNVTVLPDRIVLGFDSGEKADPNGLEVELAEWQASRGKGKP